MTIPDLDGATQLPSPEYYSADPGEFAALWNSMTQEDRVDLHRFMVDAAAKGQSCWLANHGAEIDHLRSALRAERGAE